MDDIASNTWEECISIFKRYFGKKFTSNNYTRLKIIVGMSCTRANEKRPTLKESRKKLEKINTLAGELYNELESQPVGGPYSKSEDKSLTYLMNEDPELVKGYPEIVYDLPKHLLHLKCFSQKTLECLPDTKRWPKEFKAEKELIEDLAKIFEEATQTHPLDSIYRSPIYEESEEAVLKGQVRYYYTGDFFNLVDDITLTLGSRDADNQDEFKANQSLGMAIKRALERD
jgi:hypothetical protein